MIRTGVIGYGYWGPNIVRNFGNTEGMTVVSICDKNPDMLKRAKKSYPNIELTSDANDILSSANIDAVALVTPVASHFDLAKKSLENGKYIFVEKPFTQTVIQAGELIELADRKNLKIMVDHTFLFTGAVRKIKQVIDEGILGDLYYFDSIRVNLGLFYHDANVIWDLATHDFSIMDYLVKEKPKAVAATGRAHFNHSIEDVAYVTIFSTNNMIAHFNVNWLSPVKVRTTLIGGDRKMLVWNDLDADEKIKIYDKGVEVKNGSRYDLLVSYRSGDMWVPKIDQIEALKLEAEYFVRCISNGELPINDGMAGLRVVRMLEAANKSLRNRGEIVPL